MASGRFAAPRIGDDGRKLPLRKREQRHHAAIRPSSGNTFAGLSSQAGSNTARTRICCARSSGVNWQRHQLALLDADAVLAGEAAADFDAEAQNVFACLLGFALLVRIVDVVEDQRMHVAVAGVEDVGDA